MPDHTLLRRIGRGAYGEVWLARSVTGAFRAVKIVHRQSFDHDRPFEREFEGILKFEPISRLHDSQVDILHVGRAEDCFFYVMELADDQTTGGQIKADHYTPRTLKSDLLFHGRLPFEECVRIGLALTTALENLHGNALAHRDVKPSNIIFVNGVAKLADIGLVAGVEATRSYVGTEGFAAPEGPGSAQADLYSLGKVLYEISTGKDRQEFPELPTQLRELPDREGLMELNAVIARACRHDPKDRYVSATAMRADLELLQSGKSLARLHRMEARLRFVQRAGTVITAVAALIAAGWLWQARQTLIVRDLAAEKTRLGEENLRRLAHMNVASGIRLLDEGDPAGALLWFAEALPLVTNKPAAESIHRIRIQQTLNEIPQVLQVFPHENLVWCAAFSEDGKRIVTGTDWGYVCVWDAHSGSPLWPPLALGGYGTLQVRFTHDSQCVFASSLLGGGIPKEGCPTNFAVIVEAKTGKPLVSLSGTNWIRADLSPDGRWLVTADTEDVIHVHDARDGRLIADLKGHTDRIQLLSFSTNGSILASCSDDRTARLWRLPSGEPIGPPLKFEHSLGPITLNPDGTLLATATEDPQKAKGVTNSIVQTWEVRTGATVGPPLEMEGENQIQALWFVSPGGRDLFVLTEKECRLFDPKSHQPLMQVIKHPPGMLSVSVSPDGRRVAFAGPGGVAGVWSLETGELLLPPCLRDRPLVDVNFSPDGSQLLALSANGTATLLSSYLALKQATYRFDAAIAKAPPANLLGWHRFSPDRRHYLLILTDGTVRLVDFEQMTDKQLTAAPFKGLQPILLTFDPTGRRRAIYYTRGDRHLAELCTEDGAITNRFVLSHPADLNDLLFTPDGSRLLTSARDGQVRVWRTTDGTLERSIPAQELDGPVLLSPDGSTAFGISKKTRHGSLLDLATGSITLTHLPPFSISAQIFNSSGDRFASAGDVDWSRVWSARTYEPLTHPLHHGGEVRFVAWSPDDRRLLTAGLTPEVKVWDAATGEELITPLRLGAKPLETALWSLDGRFIVARSDENTVRVWEAATGEPVTPVLQHSGYVRLAQLVKNNRLITLSLPNLMRAWDLTETRLPAGVVADYARLVSGRRFNAAGVTVPASPSEQADLCRSLRARAPQLFENP